MYGYKHAGQMLRTLREEKHLTQRQLAIETQLVDDRDEEETGGISVSVLSQIEHEERLLSAKYLKLIATTGVFSHKQIEQLCAQAALDLVRRQFGNEFSQFLIIISLEL